MKNLVIRLPMICVALAAVCLGLGAWMQIAAASAMPLPGIRTQTISGHVQSGSTPIAGSNVTLYAAGSNYGSGATVIGSASTSSSGAFTISFSCPKGNPLTYITAIGGNAGPGVNSAIGLMAMVQRCNAVRPGTTITVNELTTMAAEWALAQFSNVTGQIIGAPMSNAAGLGNAARQADSNLVDPATGNPTSFLPTASQCGAPNPPVNCDGLERINTVANILAACVNSSGPSSYECSTLFDHPNTPVGGTTLEAVHAMATNPTANVGTLFSLQVSPAKYAPTLPAAPADWTLALNFAPAGAQFNTPDLHALDDAGNLWVPNTSGGAGCAAGVAPCGSVSELTAASGYTVAVNFAPTGAAFDVPISPVIDTAGNVWVANLNGGAGCSTGNPPCGSVSELTAASGYSTGLNFAPASAKFQGVSFVALDANSNIWAANQAGGSGCASNVSPCGSVSELTASSGYTTGINFAPQGAMFNFPLTLAVDSSGNVWAPNYIGNSVSELAAASGYGTGLNFAATGVDISAAQALALDNAGNIWLASHNLAGCSTNPPTAPCGSIGELTAASGYTYGANFASSSAKFDQPVLPAIDSAGNLWVANGYGGAGCNVDRRLSVSPCGSVSELTASSGYTTGINFATPGAGFDRSGDVTIDSAGDIWVNNIYGGAGCAVDGSPCGSISELIGIAKPVLTPTQTCLQKGQSVCLP